MSLTLVTTTNSSKSSVENDVFTTNTRNNKLLRQSSKNDKTIRRTISVQKASKHSTTSSEPSRMFIIVKYADNQSLICNPMCSVVNLLSSIKSRTGHGDDKDMLIDLSDETGLIQDLEVHGRDHAAKFLSSHSTYILMEKQLLDEQDDSASTISQAIQNYNYIPLLERYNELYPNFKVHLSETQKRKLKPLRSVIKSPSPAGKMGIKSSLNSVTAKSTAGRPPRSSSRQRSKH